MSDLRQLQAQALEEALVALARSLAKESDDRAQASPTPSGGAIPGLLVLRSGVASSNDQEVGVFGDAAVAAMCGRFLMAVDSAYQPEYSHFEVLSPDNAKGVD